MSENVWSHAAHSIEHIYRKLIGKKEEWNATATQTRINWQLVNKISLTIGSVRCPSIEFNWVDDDVAAAAVAYVICRLASFCLPHQSFRVTVSSCRQYKHSIIVSCLFTSLNLFSSFPCKIRWNWTVSDEKTLHKHFCTRSWMISVAQIKYEFDWRITCASFVCFLCLADSSVSRGDRAKAVHFHFIVFFFGVRVYVSALSLSHRLFLWYVFVGQMFKLHFIIVSPLVIGWQETQGENWKFLAFRVACK